MIRRRLGWLGLAMVLVLATARYETFLTPEKIFKIFRQNSMVAVVALGMTFVIILGGVDLSVGALVALGGLVAAKLSMHGSVVAITGAIAVTTARSEERRV